MQFSLRAQVTITDLFDNGLRKTPKLQILVEECSPIALALFSSQHGLPPNHLSKQNLTIHIIVSCYRQSSSPSLPVHFTCPHLTLESSTQKPTSKIVVN